MTDALVKHFATPDEVRTFPKGRFEVISVGGMSIGRAVYEPGWRWSVHMAPLVGTPMCQIEHVGIVLAGHAVSATSDGHETHLVAGCAFHIPAGHDSWVVGEDEYVSVHLLGAEKYAAP